MQHPVHCHLMSQFSYILYDVYKFNNVTSTKHEEYLLISGCVRKYYPAQIILLAIILQALIDFNMVFSYLLIL